MATLVPSPTLDTRNGDLVAAQAITSLPAELSDRSDSNPAVVIIEAQGSVADKHGFQINNWPSAVLQKCLALVGVTLNPQQASIAQLTFVLSAPQPADTVIPAGTQAQSNDGTIVVATLAAATVTAYTSPSGTLTMTAGSSTVTGSGTSFTTSVQVGWQISVDKSTWYTVQSITNNTTLVLTSSAAANVSGAFYAGAVSVTTAGQATTTGLATNAGAGILTTLGTSPAAVASVSNASAATGGADLETVTSAIARAPLAFAARDTAITPTDFVTFSTRILGNNSRAAALGNTNNTVPTSGYVTYALLSPAWTTSSPVSTQERANVSRDFFGRTVTGVTLVDVPANIQQFVAAGSGASQGTMFACALVRKGSYDVASTQVAAATAINNYLSPNTYPWGRAIDPDDLAAQLNPLIQVDHILTINGVLAVGMNYTVVANPVSFTNGATTATGTASDFASMTPNQTFLLDQVNGAAYLVTGVSSGTVTFTPAYAGPTASLTPAWFTSKITTLVNWYSLPYSALSVSSAAPPASVVVVGAV
jgi:hypothetical protein